MYPKIQFKFKLCNCVNTKNSRTISNVMLSLGVEIRCMLLSEPTAVCRDISQHGPTRPLACPCCDRSQPSLGRQNSQREDRRRGGGGAALDPLPGSGQVRQLRRLRRLRLRQRDHHHGRTLLPGTDHPKHQGEEFYVQNRVFSSLGAWAEMGKTSIHMHRTQSYPIPSSPIRS